MSAELGRCKDCRYCLLLIPDQDYITDEFAVQLPDGSKRTSVRTLYRRALKKHNDTQEDLVFGWDGPDIKRFMRERHDRDDEWAWCTHPKVGENCNKERTLVEDGVCATCDEGRAWLNVGPEFGCVQFERGSYIEDHPELEIRTSDRKRVLRLGEEAAC